MTFVTVHTRVSHSTSDSKDELPRSQTIFVSELLLTLLLPLAVKNDHGAEKEEPLEHNKS